MDDNKKKLLDREIRREKFKFIGIGVFSIVVVLIFLGPFLTISSTNIVGITTKLSAELGDDGNIPIAFVKINGGHVVKARHPVTLTYMNGKKVELLKMETLIGASKYRVTRYVE